MTLITGLIWCHICSIGCDTTKPYHPLRRRLLLGGLRIASRVLLFFYGELTVHLIICTSTHVCLCVLIYYNKNTTDICHYYVYIILSGFVWINQSYEIESPQERRKQTASVFVVNHIGFAELMYLLYSDGCCFVSKAENKKLPFIGSISMILQSIFVDRVGGKKSQQVVPKRLVRILLQVVMLVISELVVQWNKYLKGLILNPELGRLYAYAQKVLLQLVTA